MKIHGKEYTEVKDRIIEFNKLYKNGAIETKIIEQTPDTITMKAFVVPDIEKQNRYFTGHAQEWKDNPQSAVNKYSFVENCETSAIGRALAMMGIGVTDSIASLEEVKIAENKEKRLLTPKQKELLIKLYKEKMGDVSPGVIQKINSLSTCEAHNKIEEYTKMSKREEIKEESVTEETPKSQEPTN